MSEEGPRRFLLIIGASKCGTTSLFNYLARHPKIAPSQVKEPEYFSQDEWDGGDLKEYQKLWEWDPGSHAWALEGSTAYAKRPHRPLVAERIARFRDEHGVRFRFIYMVRDPLERIESYTTYLWASDQGPYPTDRIKVNSKALFESCYVAQLEPYLDRFERPPLVVDNRELREQRGPTVEHILRQIGLENSLDMSDLEAEYNRAEENYIPGRIWEMGLRLGLESVKDRLPGSVRDVLKKLLGRPVDDKYRLTPGEERFIRIVLSDEMERLSEDFDIDIDSWPRWNES